MWVDARRALWCVSSLGTIMLAGTPALAQSGGQEINSAEITPRIGVTYDSNVFQLNSDRFDGDKSDVIVTPAVNARIQRTIGRNSLSASVDAGYDLHTHFKSLDQFNITGTANGVAALSAYCLATPSAALTLQQNNLAGVEAVRNSQLVQNYNLTVACQRPVGFYPSASVGYQSITNSSGADLVFGGRTFDQKIFDQHTFRYSGGIGYALPSVGSLLFSIGRIEIRQPNADPFFGDSDGANVDQYGLTFTRAVAPRISFNVGVRYLSVDPRSSSARGFHGVGYDGTIDYHPSPALSIVATAVRDVTGTGDAAASYVIADSYGLSGTYSISPRMSVNGSVQYFRRDYRGEVPVFFPFERGREHGTSISGSVSRTVGQRIVLNAYSSYSLVDASNDFFDYNRFQIGASAGIRF